MLRLHCFYMGRWFVRQEPQRVTGNQLFRSDVFSVNSASCESEPSLCFRLLMCWMTLAKIAQSAKKDTTPITQTIINSVTMTTSFCDCKGKNLE